MIFIHDKGCISRIYKEHWENNKRKGKYPSWTGDHRRGNPSGQQILAKIFNREMQVKIILYTPGWQNSKSPSKPCVGRTQTAREYKLVVPFYRTLQQYQVWRQAWIHNSTPEYTSSADYDLQARSGKSSFTGTQLHPLAIILSMATFMLQRQSGVDAIVIICLTKPKKFTLRPLIQETFASPALDRCFSNFNVHMDLLGILWTCRLWFSHLWGGWDSSFLTSSRVMMKLLVLGPRFDSQEVR